jgi:PAS domain-containing protein
VVVGATAINCYVALVVFRAFGPSILLNIAFLVPFLVFRIGTWDQVGVSGAVTISVIAGLMLDSGEAVQFALLAVALLVSAIIFSQIDAPRSALEFRAPALPVGPSVPEAMRMARFPVVVLDSLGRWTFVNKAALRAFGILREVEEVVNLGNREVMEMMPALSRKPWRDLVEHKVDAEIETEGEGGRFGKIMCNVESLADGGILVTAFPVEPLQHQQLTLGEPQPMDADLFPAVAFRSDGSIAWHNKSGGAALSAFDASAKSFYDLFSDVDAYYAVWKRARGADDGQLTPLPGLTVRAELSRLLSAALLGDDVGAAVLPYGRAWDNADGQHAVILFLPA